MFLASQKADFVLIFCFYDDFYIDKCQKFLHNKATEPTTAGGQICMPIKKLDPKILEFAVSLKTNQKISYETLCERINLEFGVSVSKNHLQRLIKPKKDEVVQARINGRRQLAKQSNQSQIFKFNHTNQENIFMTNIVEATQAKDDPKKQVGLSEFLGNQNQLTLDEATQFLFELSGGKTPALPADFQAWRTQMDIEMAQYNLNVAQTRQNCTPAEYERYKFCFNKWFYNSTLDNANQRQPYNFEDWKTAHLTVHWLRLVTMLIKDFKYHPSNPKFMKKGSEMEAEYNSILKNYAKNLELDENNPDDQQHFEAIKEVSYRDLYEKQEQQHFEKVENHRNLVQAFLAQFGDMVDGLDEIVVFDTAKNDWVTLKICTPALSQETIEKLKDLANDRKITADKIRSLHEQQYHVAEQEFHKILMGKNLPLIALHKDFSTIVQQDLASEQG